MNTLIYCQTSSSKPFYSDAIRSDKFENVIEISDRNIAQVGENFLFDVPILKSDKTPVIFVQQKVLLNLLPYIYPEFPRKIIITPNWTYYKEVSSDNQNPEINCPEPMTSSVIYEFRNENGRLDKDSIETWGSFPEMEFAKKPVLSEKQLVSFYEESFGSICCPKDPQYDNKPTRKEFLSYFEKKNNVKIGEVYRKAMGKEGEHMFYYPLKDLTNELKLKFILERNYFRMINRERKDITVKPMIYTPKIVEMDDRFVKE